MSFPSIPPLSWSCPSFPDNYPRPYSATVKLSVSCSSPTPPAPLGLRDRAIFEVLYSTGIRRAEVCHLRLDHIHVDRQVLYIHQGKGQKDRYVPIGLRALTWIARYVEHARDQHCLDAKESTLFLTIDGTPLNPDSLTEYGRRYIKSAGIDKPGACHIFRHSMATAMHDNGADIRTIQAILGHEKLDTTQIYTRVGLKKLLDTHAKTHPAEQTEEQNQRRGR